MLKITANRKINFTPMCFKFWFWKICNKMAVEASSQQETLKWGVKTRTCLPTENWCSASVCYMLWDSWGDIIWGAKYFYLKQTKLTDCCGNFLAGAFTASRRFLTLPWLALQRSSLTCHHHLLSPTKKEHFCPSASKGKREIKDRVIWTQIKIFTGTNLVESLRREWIVYLNT